MDIRKIKKLIELVEESGDFLAPSPSPAAPKRAVMDTVEEGESTEFEIQDMGDIEAPAPLSATPAVIVSTNDEAPPESALPRQLPLLATGADETSSDLDSLKNRLEQRLAAYKNGQSSKKFEELSV